MSNEIALRVFRCSAVLAVAGLLITCCGPPGVTGSGRAGTSSSWGRGPITLAAGRDSTGATQAAVDRWNTLHPKERATYIRLPADPDSQRQQMIQNAEMKSDAYTVLDLDLVWTPEFAAHRWVDRLPGRRFPLSRMLGPVVATARYRGGLYAVPDSAGGGLLYYRTDLLRKAGVSRPPTTWAEMKADCARVRKLAEARGMSCYAGQFQKYEGLTVNFAEAVDSAGGTVTDAGGRPDVDTPAAKKGLDFLVGSFRDGTIPREALTYEEKESRLAFEGGKLVFLRNWSYMNSLAVKSRIAGRFATAPLPGLTGPGSSSLGGHDLAVSAYARNKATALDFITFYTSQENATAFLEQAASGPPYTAVYDDRTLTGRYPYLPVLKRSVLHAVPRPRVVQYGDVTAAIQQQAYAALTGAKSSAQALRDLQSALLTAVAAR
ncbi:ABC transporter substrate-binding protein [Streptomyces alanosinicus]|uniref:ABC transporter substrate-binding protein n=1 Tax=Streptomyces alanosinicus TaxID=68171 RepID=A0A918YHP0_9ACTN|nr:ABC transporter substrate-binding protein [Streptomyces alanosinicus]GHE03206.1 ABC transporter substrate-binding protein [Streptomyces alanosinicus]